jgi:hypothetical protein
VRPCTNRKCHCQNIGRHCFVISLYRPVSMPYPGCIGIDGLPAIP